MNQSEIAKSKSFHEKEFRTKQFLQKLSKPLVVVLNNKPTIFPKSPKNSSCNPSITDLTKQNKKELLRLVEDTNHESPIPAWKDKIKKNKLTLSTILSSEFQTPNAFISSTPQHKLFIPRNSRNIIQSSQSPKFNNNESQPSQELQQCNPPLNSTNRNRRKNFTESGAFIHKERDEREQNYQSKRISYFHTKKKILSLNQGTPQKKQLKYPIKIFHQKNIVKNNLNQEMIVGKRSNLYPSGKWNLSPVSKFHQYHLSMADPITHISHGDISKEEFSNKSPQPDINSVMEKLQNYSGLSYEQNNPDKNRGGRSRNELRNHEISFIPTVSTNSLQSGPNRTKIFHYYHLSNENFEKPIEVESKRCIRTSQQAKRNSSYDIRLHNHESLAHLANIAAVAQYYKNYDPLNTSNSNSTASNNEPKTQLKTFLSLIKKKRKSEPQLFFQKTTGSRIFKSIKPGQDGVKYLPSQIFKEEFSKDSIANEDLVKIEETSCESNLGRKVCLEYSAYDHPKSEKNRNLFEKYSPNLKANHMDVRANNKKYFTQRTKKYSDESVSHIYLDSPEKLNEVPSSQETLDLDDSTGQSSISNLRLQGPTLHPDKEIIDEKNDVSEPYFYIKVKKNQVSANEYISYKKNELDSKTNFKRLNAAQIVKVKRAYNKKMQNLKNPSTQTSRWKESKTGGRQISQTSYFHNKKDEKLVSDLNFAPFANFKKKTTRPKLVPTNEPNLHHLKRILNKRMAKN